MGFSINLLMLLCWIAAFAGMTTLANAQTAYPTKPLRIMVPTSAGSAADTVARVIAPPLSERLGQSVVVDTRPGAGTILGTEIAARAGPDGHTLLIGLPALTINPSIHKTLPYDGQRDFTAITQCISVPNLLFVHPSVPVKSVKELIALAKARPGELAYAHSGVGSGSHLTVELFLLMTGTRMLPVPYKGPGPGVIDVVAGRVSVMASSTIATMPQVRAGRLRALAVTTSKRSTGLPDIPTVAESVPGYESVGWFGVVAPAGTPTDIIARLHKEIVAIMRGQEIVERFAKEGTDVVATSPEEFGAYMRAEIVKWAKVVKAAGIKPE